MSSFDDEFEDDYGNSSTALTEARKAAKENAKRVKELEAELQSFRKESRRRELAESIQSKGLNPKIAAFVPADVDTADIGAWLDEYADVFAPDSAGQSEAQVTDESQPEAEAPAGAAGFAELVNTGSVPSGDEGQIMSLIKGAATKEDLDKLIFGKAL